MCFFFNDTATTEIYTLSLHDALPIFTYVHGHEYRAGLRYIRTITDKPIGMNALIEQSSRTYRERDRKSTRLNSSHANISYAVFCLKKKINLQLSVPLCAYSTTLYTRL